MKILITGASGFLGSSMTKKLTDKKFEFISVLRKKTSNMQPCFVVDSIDSQTDWSHAFNDVDVVIHCAAKVHVMENNAVNPLEEYRNINTAGTLNLATQASKAGVKRFIFISSIKVNGESTSLNEPFLPDDKVNPQDPYGISKAEAENGLEKISKDTGMEVVIIRPPLVYGPGVKANFAALIKLSSIKVPLPFGCVTKNRRSMVYIENLVDLIILCINHPNAANQTFLVSDDDDLSTARLIKELSLAQGKNSFLIPIPIILFRILGKIIGKSNIIERLCGSLQVDISKTKQLLDWQPPISIEKAVIDTVAHYEQNHSKK